MSQLSELAQPFEASLIETKPDASKAQYVSHSVVTERALSVVGPYSIEAVQLIHSKDNVVEGALVTIACEIDGRTVRVTEAGEADNPRAKTGGAKAKDAISDAVKRCWMRLGLGLHLWSQEHYSLNEQLAPPSAPESVAEAVQEQPQEAEGQSAEEGEPVLGKARGDKMYEVLKATGIGDAQLSEHVVAVVGEKRPLSRLTDEEARRVYERVKPPKQPVKLTNNDAAKLHAKLGGMGYAKDTHYRMASDFMNKFVTSFTELTEDESRRFMAHVEAQTQERAA